MFGAGDRIEFLPFAAHPAERGFKGDLDPWAVRRETTMDQSGHTTVDSPPQTTRAASGSNLANCWVLGQSAQSRCALAR